MSNIFAATSWGVGVNNRGPGQGQQAEVPYQPWGHLKWLPQWLRMIILGEGPVFHRLREEEKFNALSANDQTAMRERVPEEIERRHKTLERVLDLAKACLVIESIIFAGQVFGFAQPPHRSSTRLVVASLTLTAVGLILLMRAIMPPPHTLFTNYEPPEKWILGNSNGDEYMQNLAELIELTALATLNKRCLGVSIILAACSLALFMWFVYAVFL